MVGYCSLHPHQCGGGYNPGSGTLPYRQPSPGGIGMSDAQYWKSISAPGSSTYNPDQPNGVSLSTLDTVQAGADVAFTAFEVGSMARTAAGITLVIENGMVIIYGTHADRAALGVNPNIKRISQANYGNTYSPGLAVGNALTSPLTWAGVILVVTSDTIAYMNGEYATFNEYRAAVEYDTGSVLAAATAGALTGAALTS